MDDELGDAFFWSGHGTDGQFSAGLPAFDREDDVHAFDGADFGDEFPGTSAQAFAMHPLFEHAPLGQGEEADEDMGFDAFGFLVVVGAQFEVALRGSKSGLGLGGKIADTHSNS